MSTLGQYSGQPEITVTIAGQEYGFSELLHASTERLQDWIRRNVPDPLESVKAGLEGLAPEDRQYLLNEARKERLEWPPDISTDKGRRVLLDNTAGQQEVFFEALQTHHPEMTRAGAFKVYRLMEKEPNVADIVRRIYATVLHLVLRDEDEKPPFSRDLKLEMKNPFHGAYSTAVVNENSG